MYAKQHSREGAIIKKTWFSISAHGCKPHQTHQQGTKQKRHEQ